MLKNYGWKPDLPDHRDWSYTERVALPLDIPPVVDLTALCSPVEDQGALGSCTGNAIVGHMEILEKKAGTPFVDLSRLFVYYNERVLENSVKTDAGAMLRDGIKALVQWGVCSEVKWPYNIAKFAKKPTVTCFTDGKKRIISQYMRLTTLTDMQACLASGYPFVFGFSVYESFESDAVAKTGVVNLPSKHETLLGGHAVMACGYNMSTKRFLVRNSWGSEWGQKGYFTIPFSYLSDRNLSDDFWTIRK